MVQDSVVTASSVVAKIRLRELSLTYFCLVHNTTNLGDTIIITGLYKLHAELRHS